MRSRERLGGLTFFKLIFVPVTTTNPLWTQPTVPCTRTISVRPRAAVQRRSERSTLGLHSGHRLPRQGQPGLSAELLPENQYPGSGRCGYPNHPAARSDLVEGRAAVRRRHDDPAEHRTARCPIRRCSTSTAWREEQRGEQQSPLARLSLQCQQEDCPRTRRGEWRSRPIGELKSRRSTAFPPPPLTSPVSEISCTILPVLSFLSAAKNLPKDAGH